jgi:hypothetical protein
MEMADCAFLRVQPETLHNVVNNSMTFSSGLLSSNNIQIGRIEDSLKSLVPNSFSLFAHLSLFCLPICLSAPADTNSPVSLALSVCCLSSYLINKYCSRYDH